MAERIEKPVTAVRSGQALKMPESFEACFAAERMKQTALMISEVMMEKCLFRFGLFVLPQDPRYVTMMADYYR